MSPPGPYEDALALRDANNRKLFSCDRPCTGQIGGDCERLQSSDCWQSPICNELALTVIKLTLRPSASCWMLTSQLGGLPSACAQDALAVHHRDRDAKGNRWLW